MRERLKNRFCMASLWLAMGLVASCSPSKPQVTQEPVPEPLVLANTDSARAVPRRTQPLVVVTNRVPTPPTVTATNNTAPTVTCTGTQVLPCSSADGSQLTLTAHIEDVDGNALSVIWSADGKDRYTQQLAAGGPPTTADLTFAYSLTPGDHVLKVTVSDGTLSATCETTATLQKDTQDPVIVCPADISVMVDPGHCTAVVTFAPKATDNCPDVTVVADPPSGTAFPIGTTTVTCTATDTAGNTSQCTFNVVVQFTNRCPKTDGFWRQSGGPWPIDSIQLGNQVYSRSQLVPLLRATVPADASMVLARQLIVATLNTANGSDPRPICAALTQANAVLSGFGGKLPYRVNVGSGLGRSMLNLSSTLSGYNNGLLSSNCVP